MLEEALAESSNQPCRIAHAGRLETGLDLLAKGGMDVVLLDLNLTDSRGLDALKILLSHKTRVPVVVMSGPTGEALVLKAVQHGAQDYLVKGVDIEGYTPDGGGGGGGAGLGEFGVDLSYPQLPTGVLKVILSDLTVITGHDTWKGNWQPDNLPHQTSSLYGITLSVDKAVSLDDWVYLVGHTDWTETRVSEVKFDPDAVKVFDSAGKEIPAEMANLSDTGIANPDPHQWAFRMPANSFAGPLTLRATGIEVRFQNPVYLILDFQPYGFDFSDEQPGYGWKTGIIPLDVPGFLVDMYFAKYIREDEMRGFEITFSADPALKCLVFDIESGVTGGTGKTKTGCRPKEEAGVLVSYLLTDGQIAFPLKLAASGAGISGVWEATWNPQE